MKLSHVINAVYFSPWNMDKLAWRAQVHAIVKPRLETWNLDLPKSDNPAMKFDGEPMPQMEITPQGVAIVPIQGTLIHKASLFEKQCGACSYQDIKDNISSAMDQGVSKIVLNVDSPGGMSMGASETGAFVQSVADFIRIEAVTDGLMCSAAYEVCCAAHKISATPTAQVGSIETYLAWLDESLRYEMDGYKVDVITDGKFKGLGVPGTSLTPEQRDYLLSNVRQYSTLFKDHVEENRPVDASTMQGQSFIGSNAVDVGLVDEIVQDIEECFEC